jgi:hypothetical protein
MKLQPAQQRSSANPAQRPSTLSVAEPQVEAPRDPTPPVDDASAAASDALAGPAPGEVNDTAARELLEQELLRRAFDGLPAGQTPTGFARAVVETVHSARNLAFLLDVQPLRQRLNELHEAHGAFPFRDVSAILLVQLNSAFAKIGFAEGRQLIANQLDQLGAAGQLPKSCEGQPDKAAVFSREFKSDIAWTGAAYDRYYHRK